MQRRDVMRTMLAAAAATNAAAGTHKSGTLAGGTSAAATSAAGTSAAGTSAACTSVEGASRPSRRSPAFNHYVAAPDGTNLYCREWGRGPSILFLNSAALPVEMWNYQVTAFADAGFRCLTYDRRGHGRSEVPAHGYDYDTLADDLDAVIEALELRDLTLVSHSMGGGEIVRYLTRHGVHRIARSILLAPTTPFLLQTTDNPHGIPRETFESLRAGWRKDYPRWVADNTDAFFTAETSTAMKAWMVGLITQISVPVAIACNHAITSTDFRAEMKAIQTPTMVIHGDRDASAPLPLTGQPSAALIPRCRLKVYEGAPHGLMYTHAERLHADMLDFIRDGGGHS